MDFTTLLHQGQASAWLFLPVALLLGALHGLEPGHSKTMMAAFIIAVRGTIAQAALLGLAAAFSHSLVIWTLAALALRYGSQWNVETTEPYLQVGTGVTVTALAIWTLWRVRRERAGHGHHAHGESKVLAGRRGDLELEICEDGAPAHFRVSVPAAIRATDVVVTTRWDSGDTKIYPLARRSGDWTSVDPIPEPHDFQAEVAVKSPDGLELFKTTFSDDAGHDHARDHEDEENDAHARMHTEDIRRRFTGRPVTTMQIVLFGLTGGLMPCPAALSVLLICLQLKKFTLGFSLVAAFSLGLALTLVTVGVVAAWGAGRLMQGPPGRFSSLVRNVPYLSSGMLIVLGVILFARGLAHLP